MTTYLELVQKQVDFLNEVASFFSTENPDLSSASSHTFDGIARLYTQNLGALSSLDKSLGLHAASHITENPKKFNASFVDTVNGFVTSLESPRMS